MPAMLSTLSARRGLLAALLVLGNAGCSGGGPDAALPSVSAEALRKLSASDPAVVRASERFRSADAVRGRSLFGQCLVCHALDDVTGGRQGPTLAGIWGRRTGQVAGFAYSSALAGADFLWTTEAMEAWIAAPLRLLPGLADELRRPFQRARPY